MSKFAYTLEILNKEIGSLIHQVRTLDMYLIEIEGVESKIKELNAQINELQYVHKVISKLDNEDGDE